MSLTTTIPETAMVRDPLARNSDMLFILIVLAVGMLFIVPILRFSPEEATETVTAPRKSHRQIRDHYSSVAAVVGVMRDIAAGFDPSGSYSRVSSEPDSESYELQEPMSNSSSSPRRPLRISEQLLTTRKKVSPVEMIDLLSGD